MSEEWRDITGYEGYQVSDLGRVRSLDRIVPYGKGSSKRLKGKILKPSDYKSRPYQAIPLSVESKPKLYRVHRLVTRAFLGPCPDGYEVCHGPHGKLDNRLSNLSYGTKSQNQLDRYRDGTINNKPIRRSDGKEYPSATIAERETGVCRKSISAVCNKYVHPNGRRHLTAGGFRWEFT